MKKIIAWSIVLLWMVAGCAIPAGNKQVEFTPLVRGEFSARPQPAKISQEPDDALLEQGYAKLGTIEVEDVLERCLPDGNQLKCSPVSGAENHSANILKAAAGRGGDLVTLSRNQQRSKKEITRQGKCLYWTTVSRSSTVWNPAALRYEHGYVNERQCGLYETVAGEDLVLSSAGTIWRHEPKMAEAQRFSRRLMLAASQGDLGTVRNLVQQGVDVNIRSMNGELALGVAAGHGQKDVVQYLLQAGADINATDDTGTALHWAARKGQVEMARFLLAKGAGASTPNPHVSDPHSGITPIFEAASSGKVEIIRLLLENGAKADEKTTKGVTPLMLAAGNDQPAAVKALIAAGADVNAKSEEIVLIKRVMRLTPLLFAVAFADADIIIMLLEKGANTNEEISDRGTRVCDVAGIRPEIYLLVNGYANGTTGYIDQRGKLVVPMHLLEALAYTDGLAAVKPGPRWGFMDKAGKMVIPPRFTHAKSFSEGLAPVYEFGYWGYIDRQGEFVIPPLFIEANPFSEGLAAVRTDNGKWGYINKKGEFVIKAAYDAARLFSEGHAVVGYGRPETFDLKWRAIDTTGKAVTAKYEAMSSFQDGLASVKDGKKWGYIDKNDRWVIAPQFRYAGNFCEGLAQAKTMEGEYGYIDKKGGFIIQPQFSSANDFCDGLAPVGFPLKKSGGGKYGYIDKTGRVAVPQQFWSALAFSEGRAPVEIGESITNKKWGYLDTRGKVVIAPGYDYAMLFSEGRAAVTIKDKKKWVAEWRALQKKQAGPSSPARRKSVQ